MNKVFEKKSGDRTIEWEFPKYDFVVKKDFLKQLKKAVELLESENKGLKYLRLILGSDKDKIEYKLIV